MNCPKCTAEIKAGLNFCNRCGTRVNFQHLDNYEAPLKRTKIFFFVILAYIAVIHILSEYTAYNSIFITDALLALLVTVFGVINIKNLAPVILPKRAEPGLISLIVLGFSVAAFIVKEFGDFLQRDVFNTRESRYYDAFIDSPSPLVLCILSIGVFPAVFEEIAFRGILYYDLHSILPAKATIIITAVLFTIVHFSFISVLWILPLGILFGYLRYKKSCLFYGMIAHFVYNTTIVLLEYFDADVF